jgi:transcriptional regulator with XRE-family HTH domain
MRLGLIAAREARGWSQKRVADAIQKDRSSITHYERGDCDIPGKVLQQLAALFDLPIDVLLAQHAPGTVASQEETSHV